MKNLILPAVFLLSFNHLAIAGDSAPLPYPDVPGSGSGGGQGGSSGGKGGWKKSTSNEAGSSAKKGVVSSTNTGRATYKPASSKVKIEGKNVVRNSDITTSNH